MARQLYDYWFVQFDFPNEEGKPYKSSGGKMVYNPILKREIPEGWEVKKIGDIATTFSGGTPDIEEAVYKHMEKLWEEDCKKEDGRMAKMINAGLKKDK